MASGMLLERLFVKVQVDYEDKGLKEADKDVDNLEKGVIDLSKALNLLTAALTGAATAGLYAFTGWDRQMSTLAIKAGVMRKEFSALYEEQSRAIGREIGVDPVRPAQAFQRAHSQGFVGRDADEIVRASMILQRENIMDGPAAVDAAIAISKGSGGRLSPMRSLEQVVAAGQVGQGETSNYIMGAKDLAPIGRAIGIELNEMMAGFGVTTGQAASPEMARTSMRAAVEFLLKNPTAQAQELMASRGTSIEQLKATADRSLVEFLEFIRDNFAEDEFFKLTGSVEGSKGLGFLIPEIETIRRNARAINEKAPGVIEGIEEDSGRDFSSLLDKLNATFQDFIKQYGKPFATMLRPLVIAATGLLNGILILNDATDGLLMWIPALITAILGLRLALIVGARLWAGAQAVGAAASGAGGLLGLLGLGGAAGVAGVGGIAFKSAIKSMFVWMGKTITSSLVTMFKYVMGALLAVVAIAMLPLTAAALNAGAMVKVFAASLVFAKRAIINMFGIRGALIPSLSLLSKMAFLAGGTLAVLGAKVLGFIALFAGLAYLGYKTGSALWDYATMSPEERKAIRDREKAENNASTAESSAAWEQLRAEWAMFMNDPASREFGPLSAEANAAIAEGFDWINDQIRQRIDFFANLDQNISEKWEELKAAAAKGLINIIDSFGGSFSGRSLMFDIQTELADAGIDLYKMADGAGLVDKHGNMIFTDPQQFMNADSATAASAFAGKGLTIHNENEWTLTLTMPDGSTQTFEAVDETSNVMDDYSDTPADAINRSSQTFQIGG